MLDHQMPFPVSPPTVVCAAKVDTTVGVGDHGLDGVGNNNSKSG